MKYIIIFLLLNILIAGCKTTYRDENLIRIDKNQEFKGYEIRSGEIYDIATNQNLYEKTQRHEHKKDRGENVLYSSCSFAISVFYTPAKLAVATLGSVISGCINAASIGYLEDLSTDMCIQAVHGDWFISPALLRGERRSRFNKLENVRFIGLENEGGCIESQSMSIP